jgi:hypothetical protein
MFCKFSNIDLVIQSLLYFCYSTVTDGEIKSEFDNEKKKVDSAVNVRICREGPTNAIDADRANITTGSAVIISQISHNIRY